MNDETPFHLAARHGHADLVEYLIGVNKSCIELRDYQVESLEQTNFGITSHAAVQSTIILRIACISIYCVYVLPNTLNSTAETLFYLHVLLCIS